MRVIKLTKEQELDLIDGMIHAIKEQEKQISEYRPYAEKLAMKHGFSIDWKTYKRRNQFPVTVGQKWMNTYFPQIGAQVKNCEDESNLVVFLTYDNSYAGKTTLSLEELSSKFTLVHDPRSYKS